MTTYIGYKNARNLAWEVLIENGIHELPVSPVSLINKLGIQLRTYEEGARILEHMNPDIRNNDGVTLIRNSRPIIFYNQDILPRARIRFTLMHELGHIMLNHHMKSVETSFGRIYRTATNTGDMNNGDPLEFEANVFAARVLSPAIVLHDLGITDPDEIAKLCGLSRQAAEYRAERMKILNERNKFCAHPLEQNVREQFAEFVKQYKK